MLLLALLAPLALQAPVNSRPSNPLVLHNGADGVYMLSDPSFGPPAGTFPPDTGGELFWKVVPRELLRHPQGTMEVSGLRFSLTNLGSVHSPVFWDLWLARGKASLHPMVEPDFADPNGVFISLGPSGLPSICELQPECCDSAGCVTCICDGPPPYTGCSPLWSIELALGTGPGTGITVIADGSEDLTVTAFEPGGMSYSASACTAVDYSTMYMVSFDEQLHDWTGGYFSEYGGFQFSGSGPLPDIVEETPALEVKFVEPTVSPYLAGDLTYGYLPGLAGLRPLASGGAAALGVHSRAFQAAGGGLGANDLALCAATLGPPLAPPGLSVLGAKLLLNPADPAFGPTAAVLNGTYGYAWLPDGPVVFSGAPLPLPPALAGTDLHCQCMWVDLLTFAAAASNVATVHVY